MPNRLLLVGLDSIDWTLLHPLIDAGQMPALAAVLEQGVCGDLLTTDPPVSAARWTSILTGKRAWQHGILNVLEKPRPFAPRTGTVHSRQSRNLWEILAANGLRSIAVGWPASHGSELQNAIVVSDRYPEPTALPGVNPWPTASDGTYWPASLQHSLDVLRVSPAEITQEVLAAYLDLQSGTGNDRLIDLRFLLAADFSFQAAITHLMATEQWDFAAVRFPALGAIVRMFPHPDEMAGPGAMGSVVRNACLVFDQMLSRLIDLAGASASIVIVSQQGRAMSGNGLMPTAPENSRPYGIIAASGARFSKDMLVHGASILDVTPTLLALYGLPVGEDMEGRVLHEAFESSITIPRVSSWENRPDRPGVEPEERPLAASVDMGWLLQEKWLRARSLLDAGCTQRAVPILECLFREFPESAAVGDCFFQCQLSLGRIPEAERTLSILLEMLPPGVGSMLRQAELASAKGCMAPARKFVTNILELGIDEPPLRVRFGLLLVQLREWQALRLFAEQSIALDKSDPLAWAGLAEAQLRTGHPIGAAKSAMRAIGLRYFFPDAHFVLARALVAQKAWLAGLMAIDRLVRLQPGNRVAAAYRERLRRHLGWSEQSVA